MSAPYGAWMGSVIEDSFWAPHDVIVEIQDFIADHEEALYSTRSFSEAAVAFSVQSAFDWAERNGSGSKFPLWRACDGLVEQKQPFDVVMLPEGVLREDVITADNLVRYKTVVLPECSFLTAPQAAAIRGYLERGGRVLAIGELGCNLDPSVLGAFDHPRFVRATELRVDDLWFGPQVRIEPSADLAINIHRLSDREAPIHLIRYDYDEERDEVPVIPRMRIELRLARPFRTPTAYSPASEVRARLTFSRERREVHLPELENVPCTA